jgi:hypothetical protein
MFKFEKILEPWKYLFQGSKQSSTNQFSDLADFLLSLLNG